MTGNCRIAEDYIFASFPAVPIPAISLEILTAGRRKTLIPVTLLPGGTVHNAPRVEYSLRHEWEDWGQNFKHELTGANLLTLNPIWTGLWKDCVKYQRLLSFNLAFWRSKLTSLGCCYVCNRVLQFWKFAQNGAPSLVHQERVREQTQLRTHHPSTLICMRPEIDWNAGWHASDFRLQYIGSSPPFR